MFIVTTNKHRRRNVVDRRCLERPCLAVRKLLRRTGQAFIKRRTVADEPVKVVVFRSMDGWLGHRMTSRPAKSLRIRVLDVKETVAKNDAQTLYEVIDK